jgi:uncharacterized protein (UPF0332 family)
VNPEELFHKASVAVASSELLLKSGDFDGACNRAYYAMFDAARAVLLVTGAVGDLSTIKTHNGLISAFSLHLVKTGLVSIELGKAINKVEDLRLLADYKGDEVEIDKAQWALKQAQKFVEAMRWVRPLAK